jgi:hypothetical protein
LESDADDIFKALKMQMDQAGLQQNFLGFLQNLMCIPVQTEAGSRSFLLCCRMVRHVALHKEQIGKDPGTLHLILHLLSLWA